MVPVNRTRTIANGRTMIRTVKGATLSTAISSPTRNSPSSSPISSRKLVPPWHNEIVYAQHFAAHPPSKSDIILSWVRRHWGIETACSSAGMLFGKKVNRRSAPEILLM